MRRDAVDIINVEPYLSDIVWANYAFPDDFLNFMDR